MLNIASLNKEIGEFQRNYLYKITIPMFPMLIKVKMPNASIVANNIDLYSVDGIFPESSNETIKVQWGGEYGYVNGTVSNKGTGVLKFRLSQDWAVYKFFKAWKLLSGSDTNGSAYGKPFFTGEMTILAIDIDKTTINYGVTLKNVQVNSIGNITFTKGGNDISEFDVGIAWDRRMDVTEGGNV